VDHALVESWIRSHLEQVGEIEVAHERPWATVLRVPHAHGVAWFKACAPVQAFEPRLTSSLFARWPDRVAEVLAHDEDRAWLLLADAGTPIELLGNPPAAWLQALPLYAELQRGEASHAHEHLAHLVPDLRVAALPARYADLLQRTLPLEAAEIDELRRFQSGFAELCAELAARDVPDTVQHDDLHMANVYEHGERLLLLDWGMPRSPTRSRRSSSRSASSRRGTVCHVATRGSLACETPISSLGAKVWSARSSSRCASAPSRTRSLGHGSETRCPTVHAPSSTPSTR
jgi:hypothetical protein